MSFFCCLGLTAIHVATKEGSIDVLKFFFQMGANKNTAVSLCSANYVPLSLWFHVYNGAIIAIFPRLIMCFVFPIQVISLCKAEGLLYSLMFIFTRYL